MKKNEVKRILEKKNKYDKKNNIPENNAPTTSNKYFVELVSYILQEVD
jgi:hypothetical protein